MGYTLNTAAKVVMIILFLKCFIVWRNIFTYGIPVLVVHAAYAYR